MVHDVLPSRPHPKQTNGVQLGFSTNDMWGFTSSGFDPSSIAPILVQGAIPETNLISIALAEAPNVADLSWGPWAPGRSLKHGVEWVRAADICLKYHKLPIQCFLWIFWGLKSLNHTKSQNDPTAVEPSCIAVLQKLSAFTICQRDFMCATP